MSGSGASSAQVALAVGVRRTRRASTSWSSIARGSRSLVLRDLPARTRDRRDADAITRRSQPRGQTGTSRA